MITIHISRDRFEAIKGQGYQLKISDERLAQMPDGDTEYHVLDGEHARCETCGTNEQSVGARSPADLAAIKLQMQPAAKAKKR